VLTGGGGDQFVQLFASDRSREGFVSLPRNGEPFSIEKDDLDSRPGLLRLLLALAGDLLDLGPEETIGIHEPGDLQVAGLRGFGALGLELRGFHAHGGEHGVLCAGQPDLRQLGVDLLGGAWQGQLVQGQDHQLDLLGRWWRRWRWWRRGPIHHRGGCRFGVRAADGGDEQNQGCDQDAGT
jgi:hypothetical protein